MRLILLSHSSHDQFYFKNPFCKPGWNCIVNLLLVRPVLNNEPTEPQNEVTLLIFRVLFQESIIYIMRPQLK